VVSWNEPHEQSLKRKLVPEHASLTGSRRTRLLRAVRLPALKTLDGYEFTAIKYPPDHRREQLTYLDFLDHAQDLILIGYAETGKAQLATELAACRRGIPERFFTTAGLMMTLRHGTG